MTTGIEETKTGVLSPVSDELVGVAEAPRIRIPDAERDALEKFFQPFVTAGNLLPLLNYEYKRISLDEEKEGTALLRQTQVLGAKFISEHTPVLYEALKKMGNGEPPHAFVFENLPVGHLPKTPTRDNSLRPGTLADYLHASASLIMAGKTGMNTFRLINVVHDHLKASLEEGIAFHSDAPENFMLLEGLIGNRKAATVFHSAAALETLSAKDSEIMEKLNYIRRSSEGWEFNPRRRVWRDDLQKLVRDPDSRLQQYFPDIKPEELRAAVNNFIAAVDNKKYMSYVVLGEGDMATVSTSHCLHSTTPCSCIKDKEMRWALRTHIETNTTVPEHDYFPNPAEINQTELLGNIRRYSTRRMGEIIEANKTAGTQLF